MHVRWTGGTRGLRLGAVCVAAGSLLATAGFGGCGGGTAQPAAGPRACGTSRTAANVPIVVEVNHGHVSCAVAMTVEKSYAAAIVAGEAPGNGGGGPVTVNGWKCEGFPTPELLKTGDVSRCGKDGVEILAILRTPS